MIKKKIINHVLTIFIHIETNIKKKLNKYISITIIFLRVDSINALKIDNFLSKF